MQVLQVIFVSMVVLFSILLLVRWILLSVLKRVEKLPLLDESTDLEKVGSTTPKKEESALKSSSTLKLMLTLDSLTLLTCLCIFLFARNQWGFIMRNWLVGVEVTTLALVVLTALSALEATRGLVDGILAIAFVVVLIIAVICAGKFAMGLMESEKKEVPVDPYRITPTHPVVTVIAPPYNDPDKPGARWSEVVDVNGYSTSFTLTANNKSIWTTRSNRMDMLDSEKPTKIHYDGHEKFETYKRYYRFMSADDIQEKVVIEKR